MVTALVLTGGLVALVLFLLIAGAAYQAIGGARDAHRYPPPGQMVDVGSHRLHLYCLGQGSPTVVMDAGLPGTSIGWRLVQPEVAKFTKVCSYDRAGLGWSDAGPLPRTTQRIIKELHTLLINAGIAEPYVLVGHSFGAFTVRLYASRYPNEVAGIVLVDPIHPSEWQQVMGEQKRRVGRAIRLCRRGVILARLGIARLVAFLVRARAYGGARFGVSLAISAAAREAERLITPLSKLPAELQPIVKSFWTQPKFFEAVASQIESLPESATQVAATGSYDDLPLVVLSASNPSSTRELEQKAMARLSSDGKYIVAERSGHWIQLDQPELVIEAIREVVEAARR